MILFELNFSSLKTCGLSHRGSMGWSKSCSLSSKVSRIFSILIISTNSACPALVNRTSAVIVLAFGMSQVSSSIPPAVEPCQFPVSQSSWSIEMGLLGCPLAYTHRMSARSAGEKLNRRVTIWCMLHKVIEDSKLGKFLYFEMSSDCPDS